MSQKKTITIVREQELEKKACPQCHKVFWGITAKKFCSTSCRNKAAYERNPEEYRASRRRSYLKHKKVKNDA